MLLGFFYEQLVHFRNVPFRIFLVVSGAGLIFWGVSFLVPNRFRPSRFAWYRRLYRERLSMPTEVLAYLTIMIVLATGSMLGHSNTLLLVFSLMAGPFVLNGWIVYVMLRRLRVDRKLPARVGAGQTFPVEITIHNDRRYLSSRLMRVEDSITNGREELSGRVLFFRIPTKENRSAAYRVRLMQRGRYRLGPVLVSSRFPFGLGERGRYFETHSELLVHPQIGELSPTWWSRVRGEDRVVEQQRIRNGVFDDEFKQIREYRQGDAVRRIHWRTSARVNDLMVRDYHQNREHDAMLLVDLWTGRGVDQTRIEMACSFVASICHELSRTMNDAEVGFFLAGETNIAVTGKPTPEFWHRVLDALATCVAGRNTDTDWLAEQAQSMRLENMRPILVTTRDAQLPFEGESNGQRENGSAAAIRAAHVVHATEDGLRDVFRLEPSESLPDLLRRPAEALA